MNDIAEIRKSLAWFDSQFCQAVRLAHEHDERATFYLGEKLRLERELGEQVALAKVGELIRAYGVAV